MNIENLANPAGFDPFASDAQEGGDQGSDIHIRVQQRNGRKCITHVQGLDAALDLKKVLKVIKKVRLGVESEVAVHTQANAFDTPRSDGGPLVSGT